MFAKITEFSKIKKEYDKLEYALHEVNERGYGIVNPTVDDLILEEPEIIKQGSKFGVKLKAKAPSLHMIRINTETEISPIVGSEKQSEELVNYLLSEFEEDKKKIWDSNIFGNSCVAWGFNSFSNGILQFRIPSKVTTISSKARTILQLSTPKNSIRI